MAIVLNTDDNQPTKIEMKKLVELRDALMVYAEISEDTADKIISYDEDVALYLRCKKYNVYWPWTKKDDMVQFLYLAQIVGVDSGHRNYIMNDDEVDPKTIGFVPAYVIKDGDTYQRDYRFHGRFMEDVSKAEVYAIKALAEDMAELYRTDQGHQGPHPNVEVVEIPSKRRHRGKFAGKK